MNNQEAFDKMVVHAFTQKSKALDAKGDVCMYRGEDGRKCFVGALIPDNEYDTSFEDQTIHAIQRDNPIDCLDGISEGLLSGAQDIHDHHPTYNWYNQFQLLSCEYNLNPSILNKYSEVEL